MLSFNGNSSRGNSVANNNPLYLLGLGNGGGFTYYDSDLNLVNNDQFGTCTVESLDPLTVTYRVNEGVTWSDGTQVDAADLIMYWGAVSGQFTDDESVIAPDGRLVAVFGDTTPPLVVAIGPETAAAAEQVGLKVALVAADHSLSGLVAALERHLAGTE